MLTEIQNGIQDLKSLNGLRGMMWTLLITGIALVIFESVTQYFSVSAIKAKTDLLIALNEMETTPENTKNIEELHSSLIDETKTSFSFTSNPSIYIGTVLARFFQGVYISLPLFYLFFKGARLFIRNAGEDIKTNPEAQQMAVFLGSLLFSATLWLATLLGIASVLWNKSESWLVTWLAFPIVSVFLSLLFILWIFALRILMSGSKKKDKHGD